MPYATVYRDVQGVPHIVARSESVAWYALGYEQARDGLLWIQLACAAARGELTWTGVTEGSVWSDIAVKVFNSHLGGKTSTELHDMFAPANSAINANFWDNCVAFAAGVDAYRQAVENASASTPEELQLRNWLDANHIPPYVFPGLPAVPFQPSLSWVYTRPIDPVDIVSQGGWTTAVMSLEAVSGLVNSSGSSYGFLGGNGSELDPAPESQVNPIRPGSFKNRLDEIRARLMGLPGAPSAMLGSNSFAWSDLMCKDSPTSTVGYPGLVADPHQPVSLGLPNFQATLGNRMNQMWVAHVRVTPYGATVPSFDTFGHVPFAAATFFSSHNQNTAFGGTLGGPNFTDHFVLRLLEDPTTGTPNSSNKFYSYYHDTNMSSGGTGAPGGVDPSDFQPIVSQTLTIKLPNSNNVQVNVWRAESFGVILPEMHRAVMHVLFPNNFPVPTMPLYYGERVENSSQPPPRFRARARHPSPPKMRYWDGPQGTPNNWTTSPMVVALRAPIDAAVAGEDKHWLLLRDFWEITHAASIWDVPARTDGGGYLANFCCVDRSGSTFSSQLSAIPKRGDDTALDAAEYTSLDKWLIYSGAAGPVPARHYDDRMFDWQFNPGLEYLQYDFNSGNPNHLVTATFKPMTFRTPIPGTSNPVIWGSIPPQAWNAPGPSFAVENCGFVAACNDQIWGYSRKRDLWDYVPLPVWPNTLPFNDVILTRSNKLLEQALTAGTVYQSSGLGLEAPDRQQFVVEQFTRQVEAIVHGPQNGLPPMTRAQVVEFGVSPRLYNEPAYSLYGGLSGVTPRPDLPTPIRQLREVQESPSHLHSPLVAASKELKFFKDLWDALHGQIQGVQWQNHAVTGYGGASVDLRELWVVGNVTGQPSLVNKVFWYGNLNSPATTLQWIELPAFFPLIDFMWTESEIGRGFTTGAGAALTPPAALTNAELNTTLASLVGTLTTWDSSASVPDFRNVPTSEGACLLQMMQMGYRGTGPFARHWLRLRNGEVNTGGAAWAPLVNGQLPAGNLVRLEVPWAGLEGIAFPDDQNATLFRDPAVPEWLTPPYDALYSDPAHSIVRTGLAPQHTNALVEFFLRLGGHYINPTDNNGSPSKKLARYELLGSEEAFVGTLPATYPLTSGLVRATAVRALLDTRAFLGAPIPQFGQYFRAVAFDQNGTRLWPTTGSDAPCVGSGLRSVVWHEDTRAGSGHVPERGYQPKFLGLSGSYAAMLTLFPSQGDPESYFWCTPGVQAMGSGTARFDMHMNAFSTNTLMRTHFSNFATSPNWVSMKEHYYYGP